MLNQNQQNLPLWSALKEHMGKNATSFHVPGHKNGDIFSNEAKSYFQSILPFDVTELSNLDDLHHPTGVIKEAQELATRLYGVSQSFFLIGGSTVGNLAMILSHINADDEVLVQRNSRKSVMNALELAGAIPVFLSPNYEEETYRYSKIELQQIKQALKEFPRIKAIILTYPDYFGHTFELKQIIDYAHDKHIPVFVDEAHGAHFILGGAVPKSAAQLGADVVVQSAHKMLPAMTMTSFLHVQSSIVSVKKVESFLHMLQSSSPSYPLMASLDLARHYVANFTIEELENSIASINIVRKEFEKSPHWMVLKNQPTIDDPFKLVIHFHHEELVEKAMELFEKEGLNPELVSNGQILFIFGLAPFGQIEKVKKAITAINKQLKRYAIHDKIEGRAFNVKSIEALPYSYNELKQMNEEWVSWEEAFDCIAAESVTPYPPGIPFLLKGERITAFHIEQIRQYIQSGLHIHYQGTDLNKGINILK